MKHQLLMSTMLNLVMVGRDDSHMIVHSGDLAEGEAHYNGVTWDWDGGVYVSCCHDFRYIVRRFSSTLIPDGYLGNADLHETHQLLWWNDTLYATNTGKNRVELWDGDSWSHVAWNPSPHDIDHINGIWCDGERFYVSEFRHRVEGPSVVRVCDMALNLIETLEIGQPIHNVYVEDGALYSLVSRKPGGVNVYDLGSGRQWRIPLNLPDDQLLRGLAKTKDRWYVGVSRWETWRDKRHVGDSVVLELDNEFRQVGEFVLPDGGPVCELRVLDAPDLAHHGIVL